MSNKPIRRNLLKASMSAGAIVAGTTTKLTAEGAARGDGRAPSANSNPKLFRLIDNGGEKDQTSVRIRPATGGAVLRRYTLETTGSHHPEMQAKSLEEKFPFVASDLESFGGLPPGTYSIEVENSGTSEQSTFRWAKTGLLGGDVIKAVVLSDGRIGLNVYHSDPGIQTEQ